ncbi:alpha-2,8-sialyltransferase 8E-like [Cheilinus undulatus]|uniref:alpha-2,8-sialyltransferase 8E-like n=1 Tax=Cheilinus undulatus TaxID=241271 RepID=UPI001BD294C5|nr:alpha-2,8-sialyltransferase 8E-like [Cheilinus undulatus]
MKLFSGMTWTSGGMRRQLFSLLLTSLFLGSLLINVVWDSFQDGNVIRRSPAPQRRRAPRTYEICEGCRELIEKIMQHYNKTWWKQEDKYQKFRSQLKCQCNGFDNAILTQANAPVGFEIVTDRKRKKTVEVTRELFSLLAKEHPFLNKTWDTCAVVGNGGILEDSRCGKKIDSAEFVIRCNLPPLEDGYEKDVGTKTSLVTANPSIFEERYGSLMTLRRPFMEKLRTYGNALLLLNPFHAARYTAITLRAAYTINDFGGPTRPALLNPDYHINVTNFWLKQSLKELRLSTGLLMVSLALELCDNVLVYGFWPFSNHPHGLHNLKHHYYDDKPPSTKYHAMPDEFEFLLQLHSQGVLKLHLGECRPGKQTGREEGGGEDKRERQTGREEDGGEDKRESQIKTLQLSTKLVMHKFPVVAKDRGSLITNLIGHLKKHHKKQHEDFHKTTKKQQGSGSFKQPLLSETFGKCDKLSQDGKKALAITEKIDDQPLSVVNYVELGTSVETQGLFSTASVIIEEHRSRLTAQHAEMLIFLKKNLHIMLGLQKVEMDE